MSGIAEILISQGFQISGSDLNQSENTDRLSELGAKIYFGHDAKNIKDAEAVVYSSAVKPKDNPETIEAEKKGLPVLRRAEMLAEVSRLNYSIAVSGSHGKTTATSMCGLILMKAGWDPTVIVGGRLRSLGGSNARLGKGEWTVLEADEFDRSFLKLLPTVAIINNVEEEHMDIYKDYEDLTNAFSEFANKTPFYGFTAVCLDDEGVKDVLPNIKKKTVTYGFSRNCDVYAEDLKFEGKSSECVVLSRGEKIGKLTVNIPGKHNITNALAATAVCLELGVEFEVIKEAVAEFSGVFRRFEIKGEKDGVLVIDDYAHHPTEIRATLEAARKGWNRRIVCVFQPHTYSRVKNFYKDFGRSFDDADVLVVTDIYPAREKPIEGITGELIAETAKRSGHKNVRYLPNKDTLYSKVKKITSDNDIVITIGAGDIWKIADLFLERS